MTEEDTVKTNMQLIETCVIVNTAFIDIYIYIYKHNVICDL